MFIRVQLLSKEIQIGFGKYNKISVHPKQISKTSILFTVNVGLFTVNVIKILIVIQQPDR